LTRDQKQKLHELPGFVLSFMEGTSELWFEDQLADNARFVEKQLADIRWFRFRFVFGVSMILVLLLFLGYVFYHTMNESNTGLWSYVTEMNETNNSKTTEVEGRIDQRQLEVRQLNDHWLAQTGNLLPTIESMNATVQSTLKSLVSAQADLAKIKTLSGDIQSVNATVQSAVKCLGSDLQNVNSKVSDLEDNVSQQRQRTGGVSIC
jgi:predicted PurR-regulated permease PerM